MKEYEPTNHYYIDRQERERLIKNIGYGQLVKSIRIDNGDPRGATIHNLSNTGIITIIAESTNKIITKLIARPNQVRRYYSNRNEEAPAYLIALARNHTKMGYNLVKSQGASLNFLTRADSSKQLKNLLILWRL